MKKRILEQIKHLEEKYGPISQIKKEIFERDTVLDSCMGSGTTGVACLNINRNFIGIEKEEKYFEIAKNRMDDPLNELFK